MKKMIALSLCFVFLFSGCSFSGDRIKEPVNFYYLRSEYQYQQDDGVIVSEEREASGHRDNLSYLLALYRMGPSSEELRLPFPEGTAILIMKQNKEEINLALSSSAASMSASDFSLACACLTLTCTELIDTEKVTITNGQRSITMTRDAITLLDTSTAEPTEDQS